LIDLSAQKILLQVDGGINKDTIKSVIEAGADVIVAATAIYDYPQGIKAGVDALRNY
jgi:ribulose-phosphate 3-epimerase